MAQPQDVDHGWMHMKLFRLKRSVQLMDNRKKWLHCGTKVKVVMVSRFGDCGITTNLSANGNSCEGQGYMVRVEPELLEEIKDEDCP